LYRSQGQYAKAEPFYEQALAIRKKSLGEAHPDYASSLNNLAVLYESQGHYAKAEPFYEQALAILKKSLGEAHPDYASSLNNLAALYESQGQYAKAEPICEQALAIRKKSLGEAHPTYASSLNNLAGLYKSQRQYSKAEPYLLQASQVYKKSLGEAHPLYAGSLNNLAVLYESQGHYSKAELLYEHALEIRKNSLGEEHLDYAQSLNNLAGLYEKQGLYSRAEPLYVQALGILKKLLGENHPFYAMVLNNLALLHFSKGQDAKAETFHAQSLQIERNNLLSFFEVASSKQQEAYFSKNNFNFDFNKSFSLEHKSDKVLSLSYQNALFIKGIQLQTSLQLENYLRQSKDTSLVRRYAHYQDLRRFLNAQMDKPIAQRQGIAQLESQIENAYKDLARSSAEFRHFKADFQLTHQDIQKRLQPNEAAIEFLHFRYYNGKRWTNSTYYAALVLRPGWSVPRVVKLFEERELRRLLQGSNHSGQDDQKVVSLYRGPGVLSLAKNNAQTALYTLIWQPLDSLLTEVKTVHYSPSGLLHRLSMSAIPTPNGGLLHDKYTLNYLTSTRELATQTAPFQLVKNQDIALFGGINYTADSVALRTAIQIKPNQNPESLVPSDIGSADDPNRSSRGKEWDFLKGTDSEVSNISQQCRSAQWNVSLFTANAAGEENLKALAASGQSPQILHIASHGFFYADSSQQKAADLERRFLGEQQVRYALNPLERSGLVLAGANRYWRTGKPYAGLEDGILKASEVATMNLINTQLVVLSACETGLGDINGSEGVFGLQRAFKMAGVKYILMSLWQVPDAKTAEMMQAFYGNLLQGQPIEEAFRTAQNTLRQKPKSTPYEWAGFVLIK
jgi:CHAT domain-containing protein/tetratricopeptide (TPR) repeat protein